MKKARNRGFGLAEVVIGAAVISLALGAVITTFSHYVRSGTLSNNRVKAITLGEEGLEAMRFLRTESFSGNIATLTPGETYRIAFTGTTWEATSSTALIDGMFDRTIVVDSVYRKTSDQDIVDASSGDSKAIDTHARQVTADVSWRDGVATSSIRLTTYITDIYGN